MGDKSVPYRDRFYGKVQKTASCWLWTGAQSGTGYGVIAVGRRLMKAHRFAYLFERGPIAGDDTMVLHRCDNRICVNPEHLFLGTHQDNMRDMHAKGRGSLVRARGEAHGGARLTAAAVLDIKSSPLCGRAYLAEKFGVSVHTIAAIRAGRIWAHVA